MKNIYITLILSVCFMFYSCDSFLDNDPPTQLPEDLAFETLDDCERALNGAYRSMYNYIVSIPAIYDVASDDILYAKWGDNSYAGVRVFTWASGTFGDTGSLWGIHYSLVNKVNNLLAGIQKFENSGNEDTEKQVKRIKGEALMFRAFAHFELLRTYGYKYNKKSAGSDKGVPIVLESNTKSKPRESVSKSLELILLDLSAAEANMLAVKDLMQQRSDAVFYFSLDALYALKTRICLYSEDYPNTIATAEKITGYEITDNKSNFNAMWENDLPLKEVIYMIGISSTEINAGFSLSETLYIRDKNTPNESRANFLPATDLMGLYDKNADIRWEAYFTENFPMFSGTTDNQEPLTIVTKYFGNFNLPTKDRINQTKYFRYAEVVLNKIEALYYENPAQALIELNNFRKKRIAGYIDQNYTGADLLKEIKLERRREFAFEGVRFHDLRRWNEGFTRQARKYVLQSEIITVPANDYKWVFPIPQHEMDANSLPADYQNPGY